MPRRVLLFNERCRKQDSVCGGGGISCMFTLFFCWPILGGSSGTKSIQAAQPRFERNSGPSGSAVEGPLTRHPVAGYPADTPKSMPERASGRPTLRTSSALPGDPPPIDCLLAPSCVDPQLLPKVSYIVLSDRPCADARAGAPAPAGALPHREDAVSFSGFRCSDAEPEVAMWGGQPQSCQPCGARLIDAEMTHLSTWNKHTSKRARYFPLPPHRPQLDPSLTWTRPPIVPKSSPEQLRKGPSLTPDRLTIDSDTTTHQPRMDSTSRVCHSRRQEIPKQ